MAFIVSGYHSYNGVQVLSGRKQSYTLINHGNELDLGDKIRFVIFKKKFKRCYHKNNFISDVNKNGYYYKGCSECGSVLESFDTLSEEKCSEENSYRFAIGHSIAMKELIVEYEKKINKLKTKEYEHGIHLVKWNTEKEDYDISLNEGATKESAHYYENYE